MILLILEICNKYLQNLEYKMNKNRKFKYTIIKSKKFLKIRGY